MRTIKTDLKQTAANAVGGETTTTILQAGLLQASGPAKARMPRMDHLKRNIQRSRNRAQVPLPLPHSRDEIDIPSEFQITGNLNHPEQFLLWDSGPAINGDERIWIFLEVVMQF